MKNTTSKAAYWSLLDTYAGFALKFIFAIWITRILTPYDYGLVAYMAIFLSVATWISEGGFGTALIQKKHASNIDFSTGYLFNLGISVVFFILYFFLAPYVASFFNEPNLKNILRVVSLNLILNSLFYIHLIKLIKQLRFKEQAAINFFAALFSGIIGLILAYLNYGYWALIAQILGNTIVRLIGYWFVTKWMPIFTFNILSFKEQFRFGYKVFLKGLLDSIFKEINTIVIGKNYQTSALGSYSRGEKFYDLFIVQIGIALNKVLYPTMAKLVHNKKEQKYLYYKTYSLLFFAIAPISLFLILLSEQIVIVLLTDKWILAAEYMRLYFFAGFFHILVYFNSTTVLSSDKPTTYLAFDVIQKLLFITALFFTFQNGITSIITGWLVAYFIYYILYEILMFKLGFTNIVKYKKMLVVLVGLAAQIFAFYLLKLLVLDDFLFLVSNLLLQPLIYIVVLKNMRFSTYEDFSSIIKPFLHSKMKWLL